MQNKPNAQEQAAYDKLVAANVAANQAANELMELLSTTAEEKADAIEMLGDEFHDMARCGDMDDTYIAEQIWYQRFEDDTYPDGE